MNYPSFDPNWTWASAALLLTTSDYLILMKRSLEMPTHRGQMAFFAGHKNVDELHPFEVAKREFQEESGITGDVISYEGVLAPVLTTRSHAIIPVIGRLHLELDDFFSKATSNGEWTDLLAVPWKDLENLDNWDWGNLMGSMQRKVLVYPIMPNTYLHQTGATTQSFMLWGATARMVWDYLSLYYRDR